MPHDVNSQPDFERVSFYFSAHQDDWQLFMNPPAFADVLDEKCRCVFVHMTAGDAGLGTGAGGRKHPLYLARDHGAEAAIRFMADADDRAPGGSIADMSPFLGHPVRRVGYRNTVAYFLHLPDGSPAGTGYPSTGQQSLQRLAQGEIDQLTTIDGTTVYRGWSDLTATLRAIIDRERAQAFAVHLHIPESDRAINPTDHADHLATAKAALDAAGRLPSRRHHHVGYASGGLAENLAPAERDMKCAVYAVTLAGVLAMDHSVSWRHYDEMFVGRSYCRIEDRQPSANQAVD